MRFIVFQEGNPHPEVGITFNGQPVGSKEFRRGRNTFTFTGFFSLSNGYEWILLNYLLTIDDKMNPHYEKENGKDCLDDYGL